MRNKDNRSKRIHLNATRESVDASENTPATISTIMALFISAISFKSIVSAPKKFGSETAIATTANSIEPATYFSPTT